MHVVLGVAGGIAAYKAALLLRLLKEAGHDVTVVPTASALRFVGEPTWAALSGVCLWSIPFVLVGCGLLMTSNIRYPHLVNRYLRGRRSFGQLVFALALLDVSWPCMQCVLEWAGQEQHETLVVTGMETGHE